MTKNDVLLSWVITEGMAGTENQCLAVTDALNLTPNVIRLSLRQPWKTLSPWLGFEQGFSFSPPLTPPWPDLLITSGRKAIAASRYIKSQSGGRTFTLHIQDPRVRPSAFDLVAVPHHDDLRGANVIVTDAAPTRITPAGILQASRNFPYLAQLKSPRIAVLIGGKSAAYELSDSDMCKLIEQLENLLPEFSLMITASRRTGEANLQRLENAFSSRDGVYLWDGQGDNPYQAYLGLADVIMVTADSVSMLSDACTTGKPVYIIPMKGGGRRIDKCHAHLNARGVTRFFDGHVDKWAYEPLNDAALIAGAVRNKVPGLAE